jgi:hypothetical protein
LLACIRRAYRIEKKTFFIFEQNIMIMDQNLFKFLRSWRRIACR